MKKRLLTSVLFCALVLAACLTVFPTWAQAATGSSVTLTPSVTAAYPGETITVTVGVTGNTPFSSIGFIPQTSSAYEISKWEYLPAVANAPLKEAATAGAVAAFESAAVRTGGFFRYTLKIKSNATPGTYTLASSAVLKHGTSVVSNSVPTTKLLIAANTVTGTSGSVSWNLTKGTLTLSGSGAMADSTATGSPWYQYRELIHTVVINTGVTKIGVYAFNGCTKLQQMTYKGSQAQWSKVSVGTGNDPLKKANHIYTGFFTINGETYYGENGKVVTGWKTVGGKTYYFKVGTGGTMAKSWTTIGGKKYYFKQADGSMVTGYVTIGGVYNEFTADGVWVQEIPAPKITKQPANVKVGVNQTANVTLTATGKGLTYKWYYKEKNGTSYALTTAFTGNSYSVAMNAARDGRQLYCVVTDKCGQTVKSNTVTISMAAAPKITKQPISVKVAVNQTAAVNFTASGEGLTYKWYYKEKSATSFSATTAFTGNSYSVAMNAARNGRQLYCVVTDKYGQTAKTNTVTISMAAAPTISKQPASVKVAVNQTVKVSFTATGEGLTYKWYYKDKSSSAFTYTSSFTSNSYTTQMTAARNGRQLYCVVTDKYGQTVKTNTVTISMAAAPKISKQPVSLKAPLGKNATVSFTATGEGLTYKWYYKDKSSSAFTYTSSFTSNSYTVAMTTARSGRQLYCVITDKYGQTVKTNTVTISEAPIPKITKQPVSVKVGLDQTAAVSFTATGEGLTYKWYYKEKGAASFSATTAFTGNSYSIVMNSARNGRQIYCVVTDKYGQKVQTSTVTMSMAAAPKVTKQPVSTRVAVNQTVKISFTATGEGLTYKWYYKEKGASTFTYTSSFTSTSYTTQMTAARNGRQLYCVITDKYGQTVKTNTITISMATILSVTKQPVNTSAGVGRTATVTVTTTDCEGITYKWYYKDKNASTFTCDPEFTENSYSATMTSARSGRQVYCVITDKYGQTVKTNTVTLTQK